MACLTESHTLAEFADNSPKYDKREGSGLMKKLSELGIKIYKAVRLESGKDKSEDYKSKVELEKLIGQSISSGNFVDSAWGETCDCNPECRCKNDCRCDRQCRHCRCVSQDCSCHGDVCRCVSQYECGLEYGCRGKGECEAHVECWEHG